MSFALIRPLLIAVVFLAPLAGQNQQGRNPFAGDPAAIAAGRLLFVEKCSPCHGPNGEGGHGPSDPLLGSHWWDNGWYAYSNNETYLRRNLAFPAFSLSAIDDNPGDMQGNGMQAWHTNAGFAGDVDTPNDTGWNGDRAGALNRFLRWKSSGIVDAIDRFEIPLKALNGSGQAPSTMGEPSSGDHNPHALPIYVNVTLRRVQRFTTIPGEQLFWSFGNLSGSLEVNTDNEIVLEQLPLLDIYQTLIITRAYASN